jgi:hypothetical protein
LAAGTALRAPNSAVACAGPQVSAEQWIKEGKGGIKWTQLSCCTFAANAVRLKE